MANSIAWVSGGTPASITLVQTAVYLSTTNPNNHTINNGNSGWNTPTNGNMICLLVVSDTTINDATLVAAGWVQRGIAVDNSGTYLYSKISDGTESSVLVNLTTTASCDLGLAEVNGVTTFDKVANATGQGVASISTGTTATTTANNEFIIALIGIAPGGTAPPTVTSYSNSFVSRESGSSSGVGVAVGIDFATLIVSSTGAYTTTATLSGSLPSAHSSGIICTFK